MAEILRFPLVGSAEKKVGILKKVLKFSLVVTIYLIADEVGSKRPEWRLGFGMKSA